MIRAQTAPADQPAPDDLHLCVILDVFRKTTRRMFRLSQREFDEVCRHTLAAAVELAATIGGVNVEFHAPARPPADAQPDAVLGVKTRAFYPKTGVFDRDELAAYLGTLQGEFTLVTRRALAAAVLRARSAGRA